MTAVDILVTKVRILERNVNLYGVEIFVIGRIVLM